MQRISDNHPLVLRSPASIIRIGSFEESCINYKWINWQKDYGQSGSLRGDLQEQFWYALKREGLSFPFSVRDVRLTQANQAAPSRRTEETTSLPIIHKLLQDNPLFSILSDKQIQKTITKSLI